MSDGVLNKLRSTILGTRGATEPNSVPVGQLRSAILRELDSVDLTDVERRVVAEYYGLTGVPSRLSDDNTLAGRVATPAAGRRPKPASRSTVAAILKAATDKVNSLEDLAEHLASTAGPEPDPMTRKWVRKPPAIGRPLTASELRALCLAAYEASFDYVCRSEHAGDIELALHRWGEINARAHPTVTSARRARVEPERRNSAFAVLGIVLWEITHDETLLASALRGDPLILWSDVSSLVAGGRVAEHPKWGVMTSDVDAAEFVLLADEVYERRDDDGRASDLLLDCIRAGRHRELFDRDTAATVVWAVGYGLASVGSWKAIELARLFHRDEPLSMTTASLMAWSAHVASLHRHDGLAWRLASGAERVGARAERDSTKTTALLWQTMLIRSGCRVREADRWRDHEFFGNAGRALREALEFLREAEQHAGPVTGTASLSKRITNDLRRCEILLVALLMKRDGHPVDGFGDPQEALGATLDKLALALSSDENGGLDDHDRSAFEQRLDLLRAAFRDFLDDLPPDFHTD